MIVVDTNVILSGLVSSKGYSFRVLERMLNGEIDFLLNVPLLSEYRSVIMREENLFKIPLSLGEVEIVFALLVQNAKYQDVYYRWRPNLKDEKDNFLLELAIAGNAESVVTFNKSDFFQAELKFDLFIETPKEYFVRKEP